MDTIHVAVMGKIRTMYDFNVNFYNFIDNKNCILYYNISFLKVFMTFSFKNVYERNTNSL